MPVISFIAMVMRFPSFKFALMCMVVLQNNMEALSNEYLDKEWQQKKAVYSAIFLHYIDSHKIVVITDVF